MTTPDNSFEQNLEFPLQCHYKIIASDEEGMKERLESALQEVDIEMPLEEGNRSQKGTYVTFNITLKIVSKEQMDLIDYKLRNVDGVKMVL